MNIFTYLKKKGIDTVDSSFYTRIKLWDSWYRGNVAKFHNYRIYHGAGQHTNCQRKSLGMAKKVCEDIADLLLNEKTKITIGDEATSTYVSHVLEEANFYQLANEYQERKAACGTVAYVPYLTDMEVDEDGSILDAKVKIDYVTARNIFPIAWENGRVTECMFVFEKVHDRKRYAHMQFHRREALPGGGFQYVIENCVVLATDGRGRDLTEAEWNRIPFFEGLAPRVETGSDKPQFVLDKLNIVNNSDEDDTNPMGVAIYANACDTLAKLDLEYDSYANEFNLGRKRIFVSPEMLTNVDGDPVFDPNDTTFYQLPEDYFRDTKEALHEVNPALRVTEHEAAINNDLNLLAFKCGFGTQFYRFERGNVATATQVISENSDLYRSVVKHEIILEEVIRDLIQIIIRLGTAAGVQGLVEDTDITIDFDDSIVEDSGAERNEDRQDVAIGAMSLAEYRAKWYGETTEQAQANLPEQNPGVLF